MLRSLPWIILGGVVLIAGVIVTQLLGTYLYLQSPDRVATGAFTRLLDAKSFDLALETTQVAKDGFSLNAKGSLDKQTLSRPVADLTFSFQTGGQAFYGNGQAKAKDGQLYLRFDQIAGIPGLLPGALQSIWAGLDMDSLIAVGKENIFPQATGNFTEADLQTLRTIIEKHMPVAVAGKGEATVLDSVPVMHYHVVTDKARLKDLLTEVQTLVKGSALSPDEQAGINKSITSLPPMTGEIWVAKSDGRLNAALIVIGLGDQAVHVNLQLTHYDRPVAVDAPIDARPLIELLRRMIGTTLAGVTVKLPFDIPVPILQIEQKIPEVNLPSGSGAGGKVNGVPDVLKLFYGTDKPFGPDIKVPTGN